MKAYAIVLIVCGSVAAAILILCCLCKCKGGSRIGKQGQVRSTRTVASKQSYVTRDLEIGETKQSSNKQSGSRDGGMIILSGGEAQTEAPAPNATKGGSNSGTGAGHEEHGRSGGGCGGCGGGGGCGDCGGCGGCGGGCGD
ncbi:keratin-associated protein 5-4-like [Carica papaya]|uniref:keratin-associated protein 5-4-like n=1 Tax=Carica papaya TaxID=3649 RepID=UPI000B8CB103|nr:keratin-associated protein 5-4-like [Carica papaya]